MKLSVPNELIYKFLNEKFIIYIPKLISYINNLSDLINLKKIKLVIISSPSHDKHISFVASQLNNIPCLLVGHGLIGKNIFLDDFSFFNCRVSKYEYFYKKSISYKIFPTWIKNE